MTNIDVASRMAEDGYVILDPFFTEHGLMPVANEVDNIISGRSDYLPNKEVVYEPGSNPPRLRNAFRMHLYNDQFLRMARHHSLLSVVTEILGSPVRLYASQLFAKPRNVGSEVPLHQDMPYWPFEPHELISAWIALDDSTIENGCVRFLPGSHKFGILPHESSGVAGNSLGLRLDDPVLAIPERPVEVRRGACVLHHCLTVHRSEPNRSSYPRRGLIYVYMSSRVRPTNPAQFDFPADFPILEVNV